MDYFREKRRAGLIDSKTCERMMEIANHVEEKGYSFIDVIGHGTYGSVLKIKNNETNDEMAAKVVQKKYVSDGEVELWKTLNHPNILKLEDAEFVYYADSFIFITPVYPKNLEQTVLESSFLTNKNSLLQITDWLKQIMVAVSCLHNKDLSHNDIKANNVLISSNNSAVLSDFGFLCSAVTPITKYGAPFIYRCPEGRLTEAGMAEVDGKKLDIWSIGMMIIELFTGMALLKKFSHWKGPLSCWFTEVYPVMQNILQKKNFVKLMEDAFPACKRNHSISDDVLNLVTGCLNIVPEMRPTAQQLVDHKLFGGIWQYTDNQVDIWNNKVSIQEFNAILKEKKLDLVPQLETVNSYNNPSGDDEDLKINRETYKVELDPVVIPQLDAIHEEIGIIQSEASSIHPKSTLEDNKPLSSSIEQKNKFDITKNSAKSKESLTSVQHHQISNEEVSPNFNYTFDSTVSSLGSKSTSFHCNLVLDNFQDIARSSQPCSRQKFRKWCQRKKTAFVGFFRACCSCTRNNSSTSVLTDCK